MKTIIQFIMRRKGILLAAILAVGTLFFAFKTSNNQPNADGTNSLEDKKKLLAMVAAILEKQHYKPKDINDEFSKQVFKKYLEELDGEKNIFLESDIVQLKKFETYIDDEIRGGEIKFVPTLNTMYDKRVEEAIAMVNDILAKPFEFTTDEEYIADGDKLTPATTVEQKKDRWRKKLKFMTLERYADMLDAREKLAKTDTAYKSDEQLEKNAREIVQKVTTKMFNRIKSTFTEDKRFSAYVNVIANQMDPHTDYFPPVEKRAFDEQMSGRFFGIGAQLQEQDGVIKIATVVAGHPAWRSGEIEQGDIILKVAQGNGEPVDITGYDVTDAVKLIRGNKGTEVRLTIKKTTGTVKIVSLMRDEIVQDEAYVRSAVLTEASGKKVGYIFLPDFYANFEDADGARCSVDVAKEIIKLKGEQVEGIILDLRNNGGGSLYEVVQMVGLFIKQGPVVQVKDKDGKITVLSDNNPDVLYDGPLAVMVNGFSASASEIFAAAIQDYKRGIIIGTNSSTYGKGTVQRNIPLGKTTDFNSGRTELGALKLTFQMFYRINGGSTQLKGVTPDVLLPDSYEYFKFRERDNITALPWDEIPKAGYDTDINANVLNDAITENNATDKFKVLKLIGENAEWLSKTNEQPQPLQLSKYQEREKLIKATVAQMNKLAKPEQEMNVDVSILDRSKYYSNPDKQKGERYQAWLKSLRSDLYLSVTKNILSGIITKEVARR